MQSLQKIPVVILGATGSVGQQLVRLLADHPWFKITALAASESSSQKTYAEAANWGMSSPMPDAVKEMIVQKCTPDIGGKIAFSGLDSSVAGDIEVSFAHAGYIVVSNARNHRFSKNVPLLVPEINSDHLKLVEQQTYKSKGFIVTNPNCSTTGLVMALKPLLDNFGLTKVHVVTLQAISGAGYPGLSALDIMDNAIPYINGEEEKIETEPLKILGECTDNTITPLSLRISAQCNRVPVLDSHLECVSVCLNKKVYPQDIIQAWQKFHSKIQDLNLPTAPKYPLFYHIKPNYPQPRLHRDLGKGMTVSIGRLRPCTIFDYKFIVLSHNTIRGAAGGAILNAELVARQYLSMEKIP